MSKTKPSAADRATGRGGGHAAATRSTGRERVPAAALRDTKRRIVVRVSEAERADIERRAGARACSLTELLRSAALGAGLHGRAEAGAVLALCEANAELERLGALLGRPRPAEPAGEAADGEATDRTPLRELLARLPEARRRLAAAADALA
jgi:hypothetical protein